MSLEVVIFRQHSGTNQFFAQNLHKVQQVFRILIPNVVNCIRRNRQTILAILFVRCLLHHTHNTLNDIIHISKVTLAVAVVEDLDGFALHQLIGEAEVGHVRTASRAIHSEESQASGRNVIELRVGVCHQFVRFLSGRIEGNRVIHLIICAVRNLFVRTINTGRRSIYQMLHTCLTVIIRMTASFKDIKKADQVGFHIGIRVGDGIAHTSLCRKVHHYSRFILFKQICN